MFNTVPGDGSEIQGFIEATGNRSQESGQNEWPQKTKKARKEKKGIGQRFPASVCREPSARDCEFFTCDHFCMPPSPPREERAGVRRFLSLRERFCQCSQNCEQYIFFFFDDVEGADSESRPTVGIECCSFFINAEGADRA